MLAGGEPPRPLRRGRHAKARGDQLWVQPRYFVCFRAPEDRHHLSRWWSDKAKKSRDRLATAPIFAAIITGNSRH